MLIDPLFKKCLSAVVLHLFHYIDTGFVFMKDECVLLPTAILDVCFVFWKSEYIKLIGCFFFFYSDEVIFIHRYF